MNQLQSSYSNDYFKFRPIEFEDIDDIRIWRNSQKKILRQKNNISYQNQLDYWNNHILPSFDVKEPDQLLFCLEDCLTNELLAYGGLVHINWKKKYAESSFVANTIYTKSINKYENLLNNYLDFLMNVAEQLNFSCIYSETYSFRFQHIEILEKYGYVQYGYLNKKTNPDNFSILHQFLLKNE